jgi:N6-adenosine-specific RNA methylase IME4
MARTPRKNLHPKPVSGAAVELPIGTISVGKRHRRDLGNIAELAENIREVGLLHPVVVTPDFRLIAGERRIRAYQMLERDIIPVTVVDLDKVARGEHAENTFRKDFTYTEAVAIKRAVEPLVKGEAKERMRLSQGRGKKGAKLAPVVKGKARDLVAKHTGKARTSLAKAEALVAAMEAEPGNDKIKRLVERMDKSGRVNAPYRRLKIMKQVEAIRAEPPPLPNRGPYRVIVADPPWPYEVADDDPAERAVRPYPTMTIAAICALDVASIAHDDAILWLWTTSFHMRFAFDVLDAWGFAPKTILTWVKDRAGHGAWLREKTEHCIVATRGKPVVELTDQTTVLLAPLRSNSEKPVEFFAMVETLCPAPRYAELFARQQRERWDGHGDECGTPAAETES